MNDKEKKMQIMPKFSIGAPIHRLNFDEENTNIVAGMYLITNDSYREIMEKYIDYGNTNDDTYLFFDARHIYEVFGMVFGLFMPFQSLEHDAMASHKIFKKYRNMFCESFGGQCINVKDFRNDIRLFVNKLSGGINLHERLEYLLYYIWFLPYDKIDDLIKLGVEECEKGSDKDGTEEANGKND